MLWSDASDQGWGATVADQFASGLWLEGESQLSVNHRELLAVQRGLYDFRDLLQGQVGSHSLLRQHHSGVLSLSPRRDILTGPQQGGSGDSSLVGVARDFFPPSVCPLANQCGRRRSFSSPSGDRGRVDTPSRGLRHAPQEVAGENRPVCVFSGSPLWCLQYFAPVSDPMAAGNNAMLQSWNFLMAYMFPPFALIPQVLVKLRASQGAVLTDRIVLASEGVVPRSARSPGRDFSVASTQVGPLALASRSEVSSKSPRAKASCLETLRKFARASGFSSGVAKRLGCARRASSIANYQSKLSVYRRWCADTDC